MNEGFIKFNCNFIKKQCINYQQIADIIEIRNRLYELKLIGCINNSIPYGNLSIRQSKNSFLITGTKTSCKTKITEKDFSLVTKWNIHKNSITCEGLIKASSETLSHAAIYEILPEANSVMHIHNKRLWEKYFDLLPTTDKNALYGTPELAISIQKILKEKTSQLIIMGGHPDGIITWGKTLSQAFQNIITKLN